MYIYISCIGNSAYKSWHFHLLKREVVASLQEDLRIEFVYYKYVSFALIILNFLLIFQDFSEVVKISAKMKFLMKL